jgi:hypothetical protein
VIRDEAARGLYLTQSFLAGNPNAEGSFNGPLFVVGRVKEIDPDRVRRLFAAECRQVVEFASAVDSQQGNGPMWAGTGDRVDNLRDREVFP